MAVVSSNVTFPLAPNANVTAEDDYRRYHQPLTLGQDDPTDRYASRIGPSPLPQQSLADRALALSEQVDRCHGALDAMDWPGVPDDSQKDATEPGLEQHLQRAEHGASGLLKRLTALADYVGRL